MPLFWLRDTTIYPRRRGEHFQGGIADIREIGDAAQSLFEVNNQETVIAKRFSQVIPHTFPTPPKKFLPVMINLNIRFLYLDRNNGLTCKTIVRKSVQHLFRRSFFDHSPCYQCFVRHCIFNLFQPEMDVPFRPSNVRQVRKSSFFSPVHSTTGMLVSRERRFPVENSAQQLHLVFILFFTDTVPTTRRE